MPRRRGTGSKQKLGYFPKEDIYIGERRRLLAQASTEIFANGHRDALWYVLQAAMPYQNQSNLSNNSMDMTIIGTRNARSRHT